MQWEKWSLAADTHAESFLHMFTLLAWFPDFGSVTSVAGQDPITADKTYATKDQKLNFGLNMSKRHQAQKIALAFKLSLHRL